RDRLIECGLGLLEGGLLFAQILLQLTGVEPYHRLAFLDFRAGTRQPNDLKIRYIQWRRELHRSRGHEISAAVYENCELALVGLRGRKIRQYLPVTKAVPAQGRG